jgi:hypothetical protein
MYRFFLPYSKRLNNSLKKVKVIDAKSKEENE